jgi:AraC-like DNA-binding protein
MRGLLRSVDAGVVPAAPGSAGECAPARRTWRAFPPELADVLCIECGALPMQARDEFTLVLSRSRAVMTDALGRSATVGADAVGIVYPGELCRIDAGAEPLGVLLLDAAMLGAPERWRARSEQRLPFRDPVIRDAGLAARLHALFGELRRGLTTLDALGRFRQAVADLSALHVGREPVPVAALRVHPGAARAHAYLLEHFAEPVKLDDLVRVSRLSRFYVLRVFRREFGVSPHEYQRHLRLARACRLLAGGVPASRVAYDVGFTDQSHLIRQFKALTGLTPGAFAREWAGGARRAPAATSAGRAAVLA